MIYNTLDQVIGTQDSVQRMKAPQEWTVTKYDAMGRPVITGIFQHTGSTAGVNNLTTVQGLADAVATQWETTTTTGNGYTASAWPATITTVLSVTYYDSYSSIPGLPSMYNQLSNTLYSSHTTGLVTATKTLVLNTTADYLWSVPYYDEDGEVIRTFTQHYLGGSSSLSQYNYDDVQPVYNFVKQPISVVRYHNVKNSGGTAATLSLTSTDLYTYDHMGRKLKSYNTLKDGANAAQAQVLVAQSNYNELGQLKQKGLHSLNGTSFLQNVDYRYNARGWLTNINNGGLTIDTYTSTDSNDQFGMDLKYDDAASPQYNGNIGNIKTLTGIVSGDSYPALTYNYTYDKLNRLTDAISTTATTGDGFYSENLVYDVMGNIQTLKRYEKNGTAAQLIDNLNYIYISGNKVDRIDDSGTTAGFNNVVSQAGEYTYDGNGSQLTDLNKGLTQAYNMLNLPQTVTKSGISIAYIYDATGRKLRKLSTASGTTTVTEYIGGIQYQYSTATPVLDFISTEEGRARKSGSVYKYEYDLKDHLGDTRITTTWNPSDATQMTPYNVQRNDYYAFGYVIQSTAYSIFPKNEYLYNHKELQEETGLYDYGARFYDPVIGRWGAVDPLVEAGQESTSPYGYVFDDPIKLTDPDGRAPCCGGFGDVVDLAAGAAHAYLSDITTGNLPPAQYGNSSVGAFGEKLGHLVALGQGVSEMSSGGTGAVAGVVGAPETLGASLAVEAPSIALAGHGAFTSKNAVVGLLSGNGVLNASSAQPSSDQTPQKEPNGNSHASQKPQHGYSIRDPNGNVLEYGISGQKTKTDHTGVVKSPRIAQKLKTKYNNQPGITGQFEAWLKHRAEAIQWEKDQVSNFKDNNNGQKPPGQIRP